MMTITHQTLPDIGDDALCFGLEHQLNLVNTLGDHPQWQYSYPDLVTIIGEAGQAVFTAQILATVSHGTLWKWAWADPTLPGHVTTLTNKIRIYGDLHHVDAFTDSAVWVDETSAILLAGATKTITNQWTTFAFTPADGWQVFAALTEPQMPLPPPTATSTAQVIGAAAEHMRDVPRAVCAYARHRGLRAMKFGDRVCVGHATWRVSAKLGAHGELTSLEVESDT